MRNPNPLLSNEAIKTLLITELYNTGCLNGLYFGKAKVKNPIKSYITSCLYKQRMSNSPELIEDCYNECFKHLQLMSADKVVALHSEAPAKLIAYALRIIALKCFAVDPRYGNPKHSLIQGLAFSSVFNGNHTVDPCDDQSTVSAEALDWTCSHDENKTRTHVITSQDNEPDEFEAQYGFSVESVLERLTDDERAMFYTMTASKVRGKVSNENKRKRQELITKILSLKQQLAA